MDEVIAANGGAVAVTGDDNDVQLRVGQLDAGGKRNGTAMSGVQRIKIHVAGSSGGAADTGNDDGLIAVQPLFLNGLDDSFCGNTVTTAWTPEVWQAVLARMLFKGSFHYLLPPATRSSIPSRISSGSKIVISYLAQSSTGHWPAAARSTSPTIWP